MTSHQRSHVLRLSPYYLFPDRPLSRRELQYEPIGGMQVQITQLSEALDREGVAQTVVLPRRSGLPPQKQQRRITFRFLRLPVLPITTPSKGYAGLLLYWSGAVLAWCAWQAIRGRRATWDVIHVHCSELPWTYVTAVGAKALMGRPLVLTIHCSSIVTFEPSNALGRILGAVAAVAERYALTRADVVTVLTQRLANEYVERGLVELARIEVIPDGVDLTLFRPPSSDEDGIDGGPVVYCGRFAPEKGWADFVAAAAILRDAGHSDVRYVMFGDGNELTRCREELRTRQLEHQVSLVGHVGRSEIALGLGRAQVVVVPSHHEELGGTVLEALALGRPVVATSVGGLPEVISDANNGRLVPPCRPDAIAGAVADLLADSQLRRRLASAARDSVAAYDLCRTTELLVRCYERIQGVVGVED